MNWKRTGKLLAAIPLALLLLVAITTPASAFTAQGGTNITVASGGSVEGDYYVGAATFTLEGTIRGDLVVTGGSVRIAETGIVEGDLLGLAGAIVIEGTVKGAVRVVAGVITLGEKAQLGRDLVAAGASLESKAGSRIAGTAVFGGAQALLAGEINQDLLFGGNRLTLLGKVGRDAKLVIDGKNGGEMPSTWWLTWIPGAPSWPTVNVGLVVDAKASVGGTLDYSSSREFVIPSGVAGKVEYHPISVEPGTPVISQPGQPQSFTDWLWNSFRHWIVLVVAGFLMLWLFRGFMRRGAKALGKRPFPALGWGVVWVLAIPIGVMLFFVLAAVLAMGLGLITFGELAGTTVGVACLTAVAAGAFLWLYLRFAASVLVGAR
ncbi:MAG: polymer-forming cytoskeletal protein [Coprothermobacterota bacterium]|nr:polymer-forming cytoskeletal protein [Coprothermobacterota bacterium]